MNRSFYDEIKQIHSSTDSAVDMKETIVYIPILCGTTHTSKKTIPICFI